MKQLFRLFILKLCCLLVLACTCAAERPNNDIEGRFSIQGNLGASMIAPDDLNSILHAQGVLTQGSGLYDATDLNWCLSYGLTKNLILGVLYGQHLLYGTYTYKNGDAIIIDFPITEMGISLKRTFPAGSLFVFNFGVAVFQYRMATGTIKYNFKDQKEVFDEYNGQTISVKPSLGCDFYVFRHLALCAEGGYRYSTMELNKGKNTSGPEIVLNSSGLYYLAGIRLVF